MPCDKNVLRVEAVEAVEEHCTWCLMPDAGLLCSVSSRSKSRSVDHGFSPPFDLDSLRHTVEGRMQSAEKQSRAGA